MTQALPLLRLEEHFQELAARREDFPGPDDYWTHYASMLNVLREKFYPHVNVGLAVHSGSIAGIFTDHSNAHFDEVVKYAGKLLDIKGQSSNCSLGPYEVFLLLMGIRLHDVGNVYGRDGHERKALDVYKDATPLAMRDRFESLAISRIASVHGGKTASGGKDTISQLPETDRLGSSTHFRPRMVAALVRFADEICEHRGRVSSYLINADKIPPHNLIYHLYAASIKASSVDRSRKTIELEYVVHKKYLQKPYSLPIDKSGKQKVKYLLDELLDRLAKLNMERIYCNRFLDPALQTDRVQAVISIVDGLDDEVVLERRQVDIQPHGYPEMDNSWRSQIEDFSGRQLSKKLFSRKGGNDAR